MKKKRKGHKGAFGSNSSKRIDKAKKEWLEKKRPIAFVPKE